MTLRSLLRPDSSPPSSPPTSSPLHGFGVKTHGLAAYAPCLASADSLAWSCGGRKTKPCRHGRGQSEANCIDYALAWRRRVMAVLEGPIQLSLPVGVS